MRPVCLPEASLQLPDWTECELSGYGKHEECKCRQVVGSQPLPWAGRPIPPRKGHAALSSPRHTHTPRARDHLLHLSAEEQCTSQVAGMLASDAEPGVCEFGLLDHSLGFIIFMMHLLAA